MARNFNPADSGYNEVAARIVEAREKYPEGSFQPVDPAHPYRIETVGDKTFVVYTAAFYRTPDDPRPGIGVAWEPFPGTTPYTRNSELQNAETSAWGRALIAALAADAKRGIASSLEVRNRTAERQAIQAPEKQQPARRGPRDEHGWPVAENPADRPVSQQLLDRLFTLFKTLGVTDRSEGLMVIRLLGGANVAATKELTNGQAQHLIDVLDPLTKGEDPAKALNEALQKAMTEVASEVHSGNPA